MGIIEEFMEMAKGPFITPQRIPDLKIGEKAKIKEVRLDTETFVDRRTGKPKPYVILVVDFRGEEGLIRLGRKGVQNLAEAFGKDENQWVDKEIEIASIETYPGLNAKGIVWKPSLPGMVSCSCGARFSEKLLEKYDFKCPNCGRKIKVV